MTTPWEQRATAVSSGFDPASLTERAARRRTGDAGLGREVVVPVYWRRPLPTGAPSLLVGLVVRLARGGRITVDRSPVPGGAVDRSRFWPAVDRAAGDPDNVRRREGWVRVALGGDVHTDGADGSLVLRESDWALLRAALTLQYHPRSDPQDAPPERVLTRFLGRLDGLDGATSAGLWGRLALEVVSVRNPDRLAPMTALRWHACWGPAGFPAGSAGRACGAAGHEMLLDLAGQEVRVDGLRFRVRTLPDWEREQAARDLGMPPRRVMAWPVSPLAGVLAAFEDITPAPLAVEPPPGPDDGGPQDSQDAQDRPRRGPQDAR